MLIVCITSFKHIGQNSIYLPPVVEFRTQVDLLVVPLCCRFDHSVVYVHNMLHIWNWIFHTNCELFAFCDRLDLSVEVIG